MAGKDRQDLADQDSCDARQEKYDVEEKVRDRSGLPGIHGSKTTRGRVLFYNQAGKIHRCTVHVAEDGLVIAKTTANLSKRGMISYEAVNFLYETVSFSY